MIGRVARKSNPLAYLPARTKPYRIVSDDSLRRVALSQLQILIQVRTNTASEFRFFLRTFLRMEGDVMDRVMNSGSMLVANSIAFAIWGGRRDNCTRGKEGTGAFALKESARLIMCFFNEVVELFPLKRIHAETVN